MYLGAESQRLERLTQSTGAKSKDVLDVDDGLETSGFKAVLTHGIREDIELEIDVGWFRVEANRSGGPLCAALGPGTCKTTRGFAPAGLRVRRGHGERAASVGELCAGQPSRRGRERAPRHAGQHFCVAAVATL